MTLVKGPPHDDPRFALAGTIAQAWFEKMEDELRSARTDEQRQLENELLDAALMDAGIIPCELPPPELVGGTSLIGQSSSPGEPL